MFKVCIFNCYTCYKCTRQENTVYDLYMHNAIDMTLGMPISGYIDFNNIANNICSFFMMRTLKGILKRHSSSNNKRTLYNNNSQDKHFPTFGCM